MKTFRLLPILFVCALLGTTTAHAQLSPGEVRAFNITGDVTITDFAGTRQLAVGVPFQEGATIQTGANSSATLVQSNGASIVLEENTSLIVEEFLQSPFDSNATGVYTQLQEDPSQSRTRIRINYGTALGDVKRLRPTSSYNIETPTGSAGIRGTQWRVQVVVDFTTGRITIVVTTLEGLVNYQETDLPAGTSMIVVFVPSQDRDGNQINQDFWVDEVLTTLGREFRGATAYPRGKGVWRDDNRGGELLHEEPFIVFSYAAEVDAQPRFLKLNRALVSIKDHIRQTHHPPRLFHFLLGGQPLFLAIEAP